MKKTKIIEIGSGKLQGYIDKGIEVYKGVPYAEPPVGDLRFNHLNRRNRGEVF